MDATEFPCLHCSSAVEDHHEAVACDTCDGWQHIRCNTGISRYIYRRMMSGQITRSFICFHCLTDQVPMQTDDSPSIAADITNEGYDRTDGTEASFNITDSFSTDEPLEESTISEPSPADNTIEDIPSTFEEVEGATLRGGVKLIHSIGFSFSKKRSTASVTYWWCSHRSKDRRCPATVVQRGTTYTLGRHEHIHPADPGMGNRIKISKEVKLAAQQNVFTSAMSLVETAFDKVDANSNLPNQHLLARQANRSRQNLRPPEPRGEGFELAVHAIPENFLRFDLTVDGARHLVFSTDTQLSTLQKAKRWYVDGTFKCLRKNDPFTQLFSIHAFVRNEEGDTKQFPMVYVFMSRRRKKDYKKVFKKVKALTTPCNVQGFVLDFEKAAWSAIRKVFPGTPVMGCAFHWTQALWRKVQNLGLAGAYHHDEGTRVFIRQLMALPLLPSEHIRPAFDVLTGRATEPLHPVMEYIEDTWMTGQWHPTDWSVYGQSVRTNNDCEGWHRRLNCRTNGPPPFYLLVDLLYQESRRLPQQIRLVSERKLKKHQRKTSRNVQGKIFSAWDDYQHGQISTSKLLKKLAKIYCPH